MRSIASRMSVMSGEGALSVFARAKELEAAGPLYHPFGTGRAGLPSRAVGDRFSCEGPCGGQRSILRRHRCACAARRDRHVS